MNKMKKINKLANEISEEIGGLPRGMDPEPAIKRKAGEIAKLSCIKDGAKLSKLTKVQKGRIREFLKQDSHEADALIDYLEGKDDAMPLTM